MAARSGAKLAFLIALLSTNGCETSYTDRAVHNAAEAPDTATCTLPGHGARPSRGQSVSTDAPAKAMKEVPPRYPDIAREAGVDGTVVVAALVCEHGRVVDAIVSRSIPMLDGMAVEAARQWRFAPARFAGNPVARWVDVPVKFTLH